MLNTRLIPTGELDFKTLHKERESKLLTVYGIQIKHNIGDCITLFPQLAWLTF